MNEQGRVNLALTNAALQESEMAELLNSVRSVSGTVRPVRKDGFIDQPGSVDGIIRPFAIKEEENLLMGALRRDSNGGYWKVFVPDGSIKVDEKYYVCDDVGSDGYVHNVHVADNENWSIYAECDTSTYRCRICSSEEVVKDETKRFILIVKRGDGGKRLYKNVVIAIASNIGNSNNFPSDAGVKNCQRFVNNVAVRHSDTKIETFFNDDAEYYKIKNSILNLSQLAENVIIYLDGECIVKTEGEDLSISYSDFALDEDAQCGTMKMGMSKGSQVPKRDIAIVNLIVFAAKASKRIVVITSMNKSACLNEWMAAHREEISKKYKFPAIVLAVPTEDKNHNSICSSYVGGVFSDAITRKLSDPNADITYRNVGICASQEYNEIVLSEMKHGLLKNLGFQPIEPITYEPDNLKGALDETFME